MSVYIILCIGLASGAFIGFCIKLFCCSDNAQIDFESDTESDIDPADFDYKDYSRYLENILNDSPLITTESIQLHPIDVSCNNVTENNIIIYPNSLDIDGGYDNTNDDDDDDGIVVASAEPIPSAPPYTSPDSMV